MLRVNQGQELISSVAAVQRDSYCEVDGDTMSEEWTEYCILCGGPPTKPADLATGTEETRDTQWLKQWEVMTFPDHDIVDAGWYDFEGGWHTDVGSYYSYTKYRGPDYDKGKRYGIFFHEKCRQLLESHGRMPSHQTLKGYLWKQQSGNSIQGKSYGGMAKYTSPEGFDTDACRRDGNLYLLKNPLKNADNQKRILALWVGAKYVSEKSEPRTVA